MYDSDFNPVTEVYDDNKQVFSVTAEVKKGAKVIYAVSGQLNDKRLIRKVQSEIIEQDLKLKQWDFYQMKLFND